jgi:cell wall-associated NlpC family hydrolase
MRFIQNILIAAVAVLAVQPFGICKTREVRTSIRMAKVLVPTAKLRGSPTESSRTLGLIDHNAMLTVLSTKPGWVNVLTKRGTSGWIRRDLVSFSKSLVLKALPPAPSRSMPKGVAPSKKISKVKVPSKAKVAVHLPTVSAPAPHFVTPKVRRQTSLALSDLADGQLPETVRTSEQLSEHKIEITDPISEKRSSVVDFARELATSNKTTNPVRSTLMSRANSQRGTPYRYGTSGGGTFDCSGFTSAMYRKVGVKLPRTAMEQFAVGQHISKDSLSKGDLVFFSNTAGRRGISHVGIYSGNGMFIHASSRGHAVRIDTLKSGYYSGHFAGGRRHIR